MCPCLAPFCPRRTHPQTPRYSPCMGSDATRVLRGAVAGAAAAGVWAAQQPLDKRIFGVDYDDADFLGAVVLKRRGREAWLLGSVLHVANGAAFGALYALVTPSLPGPRVARGVLAGMAEHLGTWPLTRFVHLHPAHGEVPPLLGNHAAFAPAPRPPPPPPPPHPAAPRGRGPPPRPPPRPPAPRCCGGGGGGGGSSGGPGGGGGPRPPATRSPRPPTVTATSRTS